MSNIKHCKSEFRKENVSDETSIGLVVAVRGYLDGQY